MSKRLFFLPEDIIFTPNLKYDGTFLILSTPIYPKVEHAFSGAADSYRLAAFAQKEAANQLLRFFEYVRSVTDNGALKAGLELGAGTGLFTHPFLRGHSQLDTMNITDLSAALLERNKILWQESAGENSLTKVAFKVLDFHDIENYPTADVIVSNMALQWAREFPALLSEIIDKAKPKIMAVSIPTAESFSEWRELARNKNIGIPLNKLPKTSSIREFNAEISSHKAHHMTFKVGKTFASPWHFLLHLKQIGATASGQSQQWGELRKLAQIDGSFYCSYRIAILIYILRT